MVSNSIVGLPNQTQEYHKDTYWKDRIDLLLYEKKKWMEERKSLCKQNTELQDQVKQLEIHIKSLK